MMTTCHEAFNLLARTVKNAIHIEATLVSVADLDRFVCSEGRGLL